MARSSVVAGRDVTLLAVATVRGRFTALIGHLQKYKSKRIELALCVGQFFEPGSSLKTLELKSLLDGTIKLPIPTYFILGNERNLDQSVVDLLETANTQNDGRVAENLHFLGASGVREVKNIRIAFLSGRFDAFAFTGADAERQKFVSFTGDEVAHLRARSEEIGGNIDVFLSSEWPRGISKVINQESTSLQREIVEIASTLTSVAPRYVLCPSTSKYFASLPYWNSDPFKHFTRFVALAPLDNEENEKSFWAAKLPPMQFMPEEMKSKAPDDCTPEPCPYTASSVKRRVEVDENNADGVVGGQPDPKRTRVEEGYRNVPPEGYVCRICNIEGHFIQDCPQKSGGPRETRGVPSDYVCRICGVPGHFIKDCPKKSETPTPAPCWFCVASDKFDNSLVIEVGEHCYTALAKGPLVNHHILIVPVDHTKNIYDTTADTRAEMDQTTSRIVDWLLTENDIPIVFEAFRENNSGKLIHHVHRQIIGVPAHTTSIADIVEDLQSTAAKENFQLSLVDSYPDERFVAKTNCFYMNLRDPETKKEYQFLLEAPPPSAGGRFSKGVFDIVRYSLAISLKTPDRSDWKQCSMTKDEEEAVVEQLRREMDAFDSTTLKEQ